MKFKGGFSFDATFPYDDGVDRLVIGIHPADGGFQTNYQVVGEMDAFSRSTLGTRYETPIVIKSQFHIREQFTEMVVQEVEGGLDGWTLDEEVQEHSPFPTPAAVW